MQLSGNGKSNVKRSMFVVLVCVAYLVGAGGMAFVGPDEPRYAQVAREMLERGDFVTPTLGGETWFEKPALLYWLVMAAYRVFGVNEWAARLPGALAGLATVGAVLWLCRRVERAEVAEGVADARRADGEGRHGGARLARACGAIAASSLGLLAFARAASFDCLVTAAVAWTLAFFFAAEIESDERARRRLWCSMYAGVGAGLLAKGLVGVVVPCAVAALYLLLRRSTGRRGLWASLLWGVPVAAGVAAAWYAPVIAEHGRAFIDEFFVQHHFARYTSNKYKHPQAFYFYFLILPLLALPWTPWLLAALAGARSWRLRGAAAQDRLRVFALAWTAAPVLFFSLSGSKLPGYVLPALPGAALLAGAWLARRQAGEKLVTRIAAAVLAVVACVAGIAGGAVGGRYSSRGLFEQARARGFADEKVYGLYMFDRTAEFYAAGQIAYDAEGEPVVFDSSESVVELVRGGAAEDNRRATVLVLTFPDRSRNLTAHPALDAEVIGANEEAALVRVRAR